MSREEELLFISQMENWIKEQDVIEKQIERAIEYHEEVSESHKKIAELNKLQLKAHRERVERGKKEFEEWLTDQEKMNDLS
ncbi:hypothetical protein MOD67_13915 [Bacillus licheniformis]|uniref:hypothetical protein n=1 Tax=Bacillus TaxID=1386 RepID=UPI0022818052|nr:MULTISPECIES: hypothetical protein [Bacillus]MCY7861118.1 hypothetical protein [Bacillus haynesii]MCY8015553.1 hypothetical protein [Bacillus haynesii]MCY8291552.1 hypothetical protein [Bacillus haynesii]MCY8549176.1 hypothetical protein [Bacillus haynesii]MCY8745077.1 hypothetical protein [Bacillus licheniformis]